MASRPTLALSRKSPLKSKKAVKKAPKQPWVETINDLGKDSFMLLGAYSKGSFMLLGA